MQHPSIDTGPLPAERAAIVRDLLQDLIREQPGLSGFVLQGSHWNMHEQWPGSDVDINWIGQLPEDHGDPRLGFRHVFRHRDLQVDLSIWFWCDITKPDSASLPTAVSLARAHILMDRDGILQRIQQAVRAQLRDPDWVASALMREFDNDASTLQRWHTPPQCPAFGASWDFARHVCTCWGLGVLSSALLRPPSAGRKGLMEIISCARRLNLPEIAEIRLAALGAQDLPAQELAEEWLPLLQVGQAELPAEADNGSIAYYRHGLQACLRTRNAQQAGVWPLWRALHLLARQLPGFEYHARALRQRLGLTDTDAILPRLPLIAEALETLQTRHASLRNRIVAQARELFPPARGPRQQPETTP